MTNLKTRTVAVLAVAAGLLAPALGRADLARLERDFRTLPIESRQLFGPLFWLHGDESPERLTLELEKIFEAGNGTFTAESRPHLDWLGEGWYQNLELCLGFARKHRMTMWIFDEKWWPSGEVGGAVPLDYGCKELVGKATRLVGPGRVQLDGLDDRLVAVIAGRVRAGGVDGESLIDLTPLVADGELVWDAPAGEWRVMAFTWKDSTRYRATLVNGLSQDAVDWYLNTVYQPHYDRFKDDFGTTISGFFYDEPETPGDWGTEVVPMLEARGQDWKKALVAWKFKLAGDEQVAAKYQYQDAKAEVWGQTLYGGITSWCHDRGVASIGHFLEHNQLYLNQDRCAGNMFQLMKYTDMGGIDVVFRQLPPGRRPGWYYQMAKLASSISHVYGKKDDLAMVEIFGARGQDLGYPEMKWTADQMQVRGVNFFIPHSFNPRAPHDRDCPPYFYNGGLEPRFPLYRVFADYVSRLSLVLTGGRHAAPVALLFVGNSVHVGKAVPPEDLTTALQDALLDCDWMPYDVLEQNAEIAGPRLKLFGESYQALVVPPVEAIPYGALAKARDFFQAGGAVVGYGFLPSQSATLGQTNDEIAGLAEEIWGPHPRPGLQAKNHNDAGGRAYFLPLKPTPAELEQALIEDAGVRPTLQVIAGKTGGWLHVLHRVKEGRDVFFIANQDPAGGRRAFKLAVTAPGEPELWDPMRNELTVPSYERIGEDQVEIDLTLEPDESVLLVFQPERRDLPPRLEPGAAPAFRLELKRDPGQAAAALDLARRKAAARADRAKTWLATKGQVTQSPVVADPFEATVELPPDFDPSRARIYLVCDRIQPEAAARVTVNDQDAGGFIEPPLRLELGRLLRPGLNRIRIEPFAPRRAWLEAFE